MRFRVACLLLFLTLPIVIPFTFLAFLPRYLIIGNGGGACSGSDSVVTWVVVGVGSTSGWMIGMVVGIGVLLLVCRWCTCLVARTTLGDVLSIDVVASFCTLRDPTFTLIGGLMWFPPFLPSVDVPNMFVSFFKILVCAHFPAAVVGT